MTFKLAVTRAKLAHTDLNAKLPHNSTLPWLSITLASNATAQDTVTNPDFQMRNQKPTSLMTPWTPVLQNPAASWSFPGYHQPHLRLSCSAQTSPPGLSVTLWTPGEGAGGNLVKVSQFKGHLCSWTRSHFSQCKEVLTPTKAQCNWIETKVWNRQLLKSSIKDDEEVKETTFNVFKPRQRSKLDILLTLNNLHLCLQRYIHSKGQCTSAGGRFTYFWKACHLEMSSCSITHRSRVGQLKFRQIPSTLFCLQKYIITETLQLAFGSLK